MKKIELLKVAIDKSFIDRSDWVKYLTLPLYASKILERVNPEIFKTAPTAEFAKFLQKQLDSYLAGKEVDAAINSAIMNCADMYASGEKITLRAGDYIALNNHFHKARPK